MEKNYKDNFLARWLAGELSESEIETFKQSAEYEDYKHIIDTLETAELPKADLAKNFEEFQKKINTQKGISKKEIPVKRLIPNWVYTVAAACVILFVGYTTFFNQSEYTTKLAQQEAVMLPDGSEAILNADSKLTFKTFNWKNNRELNLKGEAYFKVKKGESFTVNTNQGDITVLGTQFNVISRTNFFSVHCFEGKVQVTVSQQKSIILTQGMALNFQDGKIEEYNTKAEEPTWLTNESAFNNVNIIEVVEELERQYDIKIKGKTLIKSAQFSGRFKHNNIEQATLTIFTAMDIPYKLSENSIEILPY